MSRETRRSWRACAQVIGSALVAASLAACSQSPQVGDTPRSLVQNRPTPAPPRAQGGVMDSAWRVQLVAFGSTLQFDTLTPAADTATFVNGADTSFVTFSPEVGAGLIPAGQLHLGWVVARVDSRGAFAPLGLPLGAALLWVDRTNAGWRVVHVPESHADSLLVRPMFLGSREHDDDEPPKVLYSVADTAANVRCKKQCCIVEYANANRAKLDSVFNALHDSRASP